MTMEGTISHPSSMVQLIDDVHVQISRFTWLLRIQKKSHWNAIKVVSDPSDHSMRLRQWTKFTLNKLPWASRWNQKVYKFIIKNCVIELFTNLPPPLLDRPRGDGLKLYVLCAKATTIARRAAVQIVMMIRIRVFTCQWTRTELDGMWRVEEKRILGNLLKKGWNS